jgi:hypothetical protein
MHGGLFRNRLLHIGYFMAVVFTSDTLHADGNITVVTNKNEIFFVFIVTTVIFPSACNVSLVNTTAIKYPI